MSSTRMHKKFTLFKPLQQDIKKVSTLGDFLSIRYSPFNSLYLYLNTTDMITLSKTSKQIQYNIEVDVTLNFINFISKDPQFLCIKDIFNSSKQSLETIVDHLSPVLIRILDLFLENIESLTKTE